MDCFMGLDFGTQSIRCGIFDKKGAAIGLGECKYETYYPHAGWAEQDPREWETALMEAVVLAKAEAGEVFERIRGIGICATSSTVVMASRDGKAMDRAILWMDNRAKKQAERINATKNPVLRYCGNEVSVEWLLPKILWLKENRSEQYQAADVICEMQDYMNHHLTGRWCASVSQATCKANYVEELGGFQKDFLNEIGLPDYFEKTNTEVLKQGRLVGYLREDMAKAFGLGTVPVYQGGIDAHTNMIGLGVTKPGDMGAVMGTSFVHLAVTDAPVFTEGIWGPYKNAIVPDLYCMEGGQVSAGSITKWFIKEFKIGGDNPYMMIAEEAKNIAAGSDGVICLDFFQGNRTPYKDPSAKGVFYGLTLSHTRAHLYRSVLEGIAFGTKNIIDSIQQGEVKIHSLMGCGGVTFNDMWLQIIADVTGKPIVLTEHSGNAGVLGGAIIAAVGCGAFGDFTAATQHMVTITETVQPNPQLYSVYEEAYQKYIAIYGQLKTLMK